MEQNTNLEARPKLDVEKLSSPSKLYYMPEEGMDLKLDLVKAYDTADHKLLIKVVREVRSSTHHQKNSSDLL